MDKRKSILNVSVSMTFNLISMVMAIVVKRFLIRACGNEVNGLNAMYLSIIGVLAVAELGVGSAITFCMYKPIVEGNNNQVSALYHLFRRLYLIIGAIIFIAGLIITPFIKYFAKDYTGLDINFYLTFVLMLISIVITYMFGAKTALINAYKNNYITTSITYGGIVFQYILQIATLLITKSFTWYLVCKVIGSLTQWVATEVVACKKYSMIISNIQKVDEQTKAGLVKSVKAMFMHKVGRVLVNTVDSVVISAFVGVVALGEYSNYTVILTSLASVIKLVFTSITSVLGHFYVESDNETSRKYCDILHIFNFVIGVVFYLGYYAIIDNLIAILFSADLIVSKSISFVITLNGFIQFMRESTLVFRDATGTFYNDRWKPLIEGLVNIVLSIGFVLWLGVAGVIMATIITNLLICHIIEPYVLYKNAFQKSPKNYYLQNYSMILTFTVALLILNHCLRHYSGQWSELFVNGFISIGISIVICGVTIFSNKDICRIVTSYLKRGRDER